jgi:hypothetical protein
VDRREPQNKCQEILSYQIDLEKFKPQPMKFNVSPTSNTITVFEGIIRRDIAPEKSLCRTSTGGKIHLANCKAAQTSPRASTKPIQL